MKKIRSIINFNKSFLHKLANDENSCVKLQAQKYHLALHPYHLTNINSSIKDIFGQGIAKYDKKLQAILLGYENIKLLTQGTIVDDSFFVHLDVSANFFLFKPEIGKELVGVVNKKSDDHVGCLVYETFNVAIPKPKDEDINNWVGYKIQIGDEISFKITYLKLESGLPYIRGELITVPNGIEIDADDVNGSQFENVNVQKASRKSKKRKLLQDDVTEESSSKKDSKDELNGEILNHKKSKRKLKNEPEIDGKNEPEDTDSQFSKKKHKRSCREIALNTDRLHEDFTGEVKSNEINHKKKNKKHKHASEEICDSNTIISKNVYANTSVTDSDSANKIKEEIM